MFQYDFKMGPFTQIYFHVQFKIVCHFGKMVQSAWHPLWFIPFGYQIMLLDIPTAEWPIFVSKSANCFGFSDSLAYIVRCHLRFNPPLVNQQVLKLYPLLQRSCWNRLACNYITNQHYKGFPSFNAIPPTFHITLPEVFSTFTTFMLQSFRQVTDKCFKMSML